MDSEDLTEGKVFATFDKFEEFSALQTEFLDTCRRGDIDEAKGEVILLKKLSNIPENLGKTASDLEEVAKSYLGKAGLEREGAAILLSRFYSRKDMNAKLPAFLQWSIEIMHDPKEPFACIGSLQVLSELCKTAFGEQIESHFSAILQIASLIDENPVLTNNTLMRKFRIKLASRVLLRLLPSRIVPRRSRGKRMLSDMDESDAEPNEEDMDIPEETEDVLQDLFKALQDKDTVVRYSSAKGIARIAERLPAEFTEQVLDTVLQLFSVHSMGAASLYDMPSIAEATWHGASLACAEMARRGLIPDSRLGELLDWMKKALYFDIRKGAHSVGSNVRDAASYVLWSLARAQSVDALAPFADALSHTLVAVSVFDREIHIRRAASAAFQEFVGRTSLFAHGIDVLRKTDFYAVGTRRHAYLVAAYEVAEHKEYRPCLIEHLILVTLRHWDPVVRQLGAQSLRVICQWDLSELAPTCAKRVAEYLTFADPSDVHGALLALAELASAFESIVGDHRVQTERRKVQAI
ncbi:hypothetical protein PHLCEN_2v9519 [Hermanssonia centrifuga]|uniref:Tubulin-folding cofactor D ARM repeats domain-containing protein n=1 Tax=Hermanssonia centrifuga TaxID=98765 RepID=A0A2R6NR91_9APHY|nr:hypothetical protein PHLCEN_2v9519 [Hermanssonia centrifuga]